MRAFLKEVGMNKTRSTHRSDKEQIISVGKHEGNISEPRTAQYNAVTLPTGFGRSVKCRHAL
jgi:hypothetical protein